MEFSTNLNIFAQSICTHYSCFEIMGRFVTLKKSDPNYGPEKKQGDKNRFIVVQKEKGRGYHFSF